MKKGLVLAGGGSRGAYQIGVWQALRELDFQIQAVAGTSVGALNAAMVAQDDFEGALALWERLTTGDILAIGGKQEAGKGLIQEARAAVGNVLGGIDATPLHDLAYRVLDEEKIRRSPMDFGLVTVRFPDFKPEVLTEEEIPPGKLTDYVLASAAAFPSMKSYEIDGRQYIDGGYYNNLPIQLAYRQGARDIIAVDLKTLGIVRPARYPDARIRVVSSHWDLGPFLEFDPEVSRRNIRLGYLDTLRLFGKVSGLWYSFQPGQLERIAALLLPSLAPSCERCSFGLVTDRGLPMERQGKARLLAALGLRGSQRYHLRRFLTRCAEVGGEALGLDPCTLYDGDSFIASALAAWRENICHTPDDIRPAQGEALLATAARVSKISRPALCAYMADCIWEVFDRGERQHSLWRLARQHPEEFAAGVFLLLCRQLPGSPRP
ncbi:patatin-like phospholipase family protein [Zongyangia sp. HA2173]|uniref:patatin-like phospholipase family protein n=1 Tax=Zongyangia sp. HA2173 TaxID=3133035 RepID=UPI0031614958